MVGWGNVGGHLRVIDQVMWFGNTGLVADKEICITVLWMNISTGTQGYT